MQVRTQATLLLCLVLATSAAADATQRRLALARYHDGKAAFSEGRLEEAAQDFEEAIRLDPLLTLAHYDLGQAFMAARRYREAIQAYLAAAEAFRKLGTLSAQNAAEADQRRRDAIREIEQDIQQLQQQGSRIAGGERMILQKEQQLESLRSMQGREGEQVQPFQVPAEISLALGSAYLRVEALADAEAAYAEAIKVKPGFGEAHNNLAVVHALRGRFEDAEEELTLARKAGYAVNPRLAADIERRDLPALRAGVFAAPPPPKGASASGAPGFTVEGAPACLVADRFPAFTASYRMSAPLALARLRFRTGPDWFAVTMKAADGRLQATLPRPEGSLKSVTWEVEATDTGGATHRSPPGTLTVVSRADQCVGGRAAAALDKPGDSLIVEAPSEQRHGKRERASLVPEGFSPRGVVGGEVGIFVLSTRTALLGAGVVLGGAVLAGVAAAESGRAEGVPGQPSAPQVQVRLDSTEPPPGSEVSPRSTVRMTFTFTSSAALVAGGEIRAYLSRQNGVCLSFPTSPLPPLAQGVPAAVTVSAPFAASACGPGATIDRAVVIGVAAVPNTGQGAQFAPLSFPVSFTVVP